MINRLRTCSFRGFHTRYNYTNHGATKPVDLINLPELEYKPAVLITGENIHSSSSSINNVFDPEVEFVSLSSGYGFTIGISKEGHAYGMGLNTSGQLGSQRSVEDKNLEIMNNYKRLWFDDCEDKIIQSVSCGRQHSALLTVDDEVHLFGANAAGQLGARTHYRTHGYHSFSAKNLFGSKVIKIVCGMDHTHIILEDGRVASFGLGCDGQLGLGNLENSCIPTIIKGLEGVVDLCSNGDWTLALLGDGSLVGWGNNEYHQVNATEFQQISSPHKMFTERKITKIACSMTMGLALDDNNNLYSWGYGLNPKNVVEIKSPTRIDLGIEDPIYDIFAGLNTLGIKYGKHILLLGKNENDMLNNSEDGLLHNNIITEVLDVSVHFDNISILGKLSEDYYATNVPVITEVDARAEEVAQIFEKIKINADAYVEEMVEDEPDTSWLNLVETTFDENKIKIVPSENIRKSGYLGKNFDPNYHYKPSNPNYMGNNYDPKFHLRKKHKKYKSSYRTSYDPNYKQSYNNPAQSGHWKRNRFENNLGNQSADKISNNTQTWEGSVNPNYKGKNYDPNYKGKNYDPNYKAKNYGPNFMTERYYDPKKP